MDGNRYTVDKSTPVGVFSQDDFDSTTHLLSKSLGETELQACWSRDIASGGSMSLSVTRTRGVG